MNRLATLAGYSGFVLLGWNAVLVPALIRSIQPDFRQADAAFGLFFLVSALLYAAGSFGGGFLTERVGRRAILALATLLLGVGLGGEALAPSWLGFLLAALVVNLGAGAIDGGVNALVLDLYPHARGGALNRFHVLFSLGALVSPVVVGQLVAAGLPWRAVVLASGRPAKSFEPALMVSMPATAVLDTAPPNPTTRTPSRVAALTSMLSTPTPARPTTRSRRPASSTGSVTLVSERTTSAS